MISQQETQFFQVDENQPQTKVYCKSWSFPNSQDVRYTESYDKKKTIPNETTTATVKYYLAIFFLFCIILYLYMIFPQHAKNIVKNKKEYVSIKQDCFKLFRQSNCNIQRPEGQNCIQLLNCISSPSLYHHSASVPQPHKKIDQIQEIFENIILLLSGAGIMTYFKQIINFPQLIKDIKRNLKDRIKMINISN